MRAVNDSAKTRNIVVTGVVFEHRTDESVIFAVSAETESEKVATRTLTSYHLPQTSGRLNTSLTANGAAQEAAATKTMMPTTVTTEAKNGWLMRVIGGIAKAWQMTQQAVAVFLCLRECVCSSSRFIVNVVI